MKKYIPSKRYFNGFKLNANENQLYISKNIKFLLKIISENFFKLNFYPNSNNYFFLNVISKIYKLKTNEIFISNGSDETLFFIFFLFKNFKLKIPKITYPFYNIYINFHNIINKKINFKNILKYKNIIFPNPNSPTGDFFKRKQILKKIFEKKFIIIDEAYSDFYNLGYKKYIKSNNNLIIINTLSKSFSGSGLRIGFLFSNKYLIKKINFLKQCFNSYNVNTISNYLGIECIKDTDFFFYNLQKNNYYKLFFNIILKKKNLKGNFVCIYKNIDFFFFFKKKNFFFRILNNKIIRITISVYNIIKKIIKFIFIWS